MSTTVAAQTQTKKKSTNGRPLKFRLLLGTFGILSRVAPSIAARFAAHMFFRTRRPAFSERTMRVLESGQSRTVRVGQSRIATWRWGAGPIVLLVHGWNGRGAQMGHFVEPLVSSGYTVIAFDQPGHGDSSGRTGHLPLFASIIGGLQAEFGPFEGIIAHSLGGMASTVALHDGLHAERLVFLAPPEDPARFLRLAANQLGVSDELLARIQRLIEKRAGRQMESLTGRALAPSIATPLLVIADSDDREVPWEVTARLVEAWPTVSVLRTEGLGHSRILRDQQVVQAATRFIDRHPETEAVSAENRGEHYA